MIRAMDRKRNKYQVLRIRNFLLVNVTAHQVSGDVSLCNKKVDDEQDKMDRPELLTFRNRR